MTQTETRTVPACHPDRPHSAHGLCKLCYERRRPGARVYLAAYRAAHREEAREYAKEYRRLNPEKCREQLRRKKARYRGAAVIDLIDKQWMAQLEYFGFRCAYCLDPIGIGGTQDHMQPVSKGGQHIIDNVVPACQRCNFKKHDNSPLVALAKGLI